MAKKYLATRQVVQLLLNSTAYNITEFSFDNETRHVLYLGKELNVKFEAVDFSTKTEYDFTWQTFRDAVYYLAMLNNPEVEISKDTLTSYIEQWLGDNPHEEITTLELIQKSLSNKPTKMTQRSLEIRVGKALRFLGWTKVKKSTHYYWVVPKKEELPLMVN
jgi:hypothetical protein